ATPAHGAATPRLVRIRWIVVRHERGVMSVKERKTAHPKLAERVRAKRIYEPAEPDDGTRVLIMRLWPRGIRKDRVDTWLRELGPVVELLRAFRAGTIDWDEYRRRYLAGLSRPEAKTQIAEVRELAGAGRVTLLCGCPDEQRCHRSLLRGFLT